jgi:hypothetical protein
MENDLDAPSLYFPLPCLNRVIPHPTPVLDSIPIPIPIQLLWGERAQARDSCEVGELRRRAPVRSGAGAH